jgi:hypothetical protein
VSKPTREDRIVLDDSFHLCHITYPYPDDSRCWASRSGRHFWRLERRDSPWIAECRHCGFSLVRGEEAALPWWLRLVLRLRKEPAL